MEFVEDCADKDKYIIAKSDQENAAQHLVKEVVEARVEGKTHVEESLVKSSGSNGAMGRGVRVLEGSIRAGFLALQQRVGRKIVARERIMAILPEYVVYLMNRLKVGEDGQTVQERVRGKKASVICLEFGRKRCTR